MTTTIAFGGPTSHSSLIARFAAETGCASRAGLELEVRTIYGGPELAAAYDSGELTIGEMGSPPAITAMGKGRRLRIIGSSMRRGLALFFVVRPEIRSFADLRGKRLGALSIGSCSDWFLRGVLSQNGIDPERDVTIEGLGNRHAGVLDLFASGHLSGALLSGLNVVMGEKACCLTSWGQAFELADLPQVQWSVYVANQAYAREQRDQARAILDVLREAGNLAESDPDLWIRFTAKRFGLEEEEARRVYAMERPFLHFKGEVDREGLRNALRIQHQLGATARELHLDDVLLDI